LTAGSEWAEKTRQIVTEMENFDIDAAKALIVTLEDELI